MIPECKEEHTCYCTELLGINCGIPHRIGEGRCRFRMIETPMYLGVCFRSSSVVYLVGTREFLLSTLTYLGYRQHDCGCWSGR